MPNNIELPKEVWLCTFLPGGVLFGRPASNCPAYLNDARCREQREGPVGKLEFLPCLARRCYIVTADCYERFGAEAVVLWKLVENGLTPGGRAELVERAKKLLGGADPATVLAEDE